MDEQKLKSIPMFASLERDELRRLAQATDEIDVREGKGLLHQGEFAYEFMVIQDGQAEVTRDGEHVADLGRATSWARSRRSSAASAMPPSSPARRCAWP